jgi:uncharacterized protein (TIGR02996 family)
VNELAAFLETIRLTPDDNNARLAFADWLDENHPATPVLSDALPKGFNAYWHRRSVSSELFAGFRYRRPASTGKWSNADIIEALVTVFTAITGSVCDRVGSTSIGGLPVLVIESAVQEDAALDVCRKLQRRVGGCPMSYSRRAARSEQAVRISLWFTAMPSEEQLAKEGAEQAAEIMQWISASEKTMERLRERAEKRTQK